MKQAPKQNPGWRAGVCRDHSERQLSNADFTRIPAQLPLQKWQRPLRTFKAEHGDFCRFAFAPRKRDRRLTPGELNAKRREAAWRTVCAALRKHRIDIVIDIARDLSTTWHRYRSLPNCPPAFAFDELDAVRMVLDAAGYQR